MSCCLCCYLYERVPLTQLARAYEEQQMKTISLGSQYNTMQLIKQSHNVFGSLYSPLATTARVHFTHSQIGSTLSNVYILIHEEHPLFVQ